MRKDELKKYAFRITNASRTELIVIMYDVILSDIDSAGEYFEDGRDGEATAEVKHALKFIRELIAALDFKYAISRELYSIYVYSQQQLLEVVYTRCREPLSGVRDMIEKLRSAFDTISKQQQEKPMMENTQQVYAGLTYGRDNLTESVVDNHTINRGFLA